MMCGQHDCSQQYVCRIADFAFLMFIKPPIVQIKDALGLQIVHIWRHQASHAMARSIQDTMISSSKTNILPLRQCNYTISRTTSGSQSHQANHQMTCVEAARVRASGSICSLRCELWFYAENTGKPSFMLS